MMEEKNRRHPRFPFWLRLFGASAFVIVLTAFTVGLIGYTQAREAVLRLAKQQVLSIVRERHAHLRTWIEERSRAAEASAASREVLIALEQHAQGLPTASMAGRLALSQSQRRAHHDEAIRNVVLVDNQAQIVAYNGDPDEARTIAASTEVKAALAGETTLGPIHLNLSGIPSVNLAAHVHSPDSRVIGAYIYQYATEETINPILMDTTSQKPGGESYLVDANHVMLTPSLAHSHPDPLTHKMVIPPVVEALKGESGVMVYEGFLGGQVVGGYSYIPEQQWALVTEMNLEDAYSPLGLFLQRTSFITLLALLGMLALALLLTRIWTGPLQHVINASREVADGNYQISLPQSNREDEMAVLIQVFNQMVEGINRSRENLRLSHLRLMQSEKMAEIGILLASVVHEMRNPLSSIKVNLRLLERKMNPESGSPALFSNLGEDLERLEEMLTGLLDYSRPPSTSEELIDVPALLQTVAESTRSLAQNLNVQVKVLLPENSVVLQGDMEALRLSLENLLTNAIQASSAGQEVRLRLIQTGNSFTIEVEDQGQGMSDFVRDRLYEPFFTTRDDGIGLGMSNVKKYVDHLDGTIEVESAEGHGTRVRLHFVQGGR